jgi:hypothetical protein
MVTNPETAPLVNWRNHFRGAESMQEHQAHDGQVARGAEAGPEARHLLD